ncbi:leucine operon leader peptide [Klebsiella pneumoniae]|nr:leucine operon leader peptide [Klebsiella pneumoniae]HCT5763708.1 leucine operon leader peptide [Klebsiella variicola]EMF2172109.1 leucine operon leader peptide [Klebsiella pneumoniae]MBD7321996.1 leucine operon leader peptide [Klebsiella pneumoniae]MBD7337894.1 leucine operon leader peptide [Klebsiella pneumoniae]MBL4515801.1 leucine operon leader peptide [Klebsiella pneumoniae]
MIRTARITSLLLNACHLRGRLLGDVQR